MNLIEIDFISSEVKRKSGIDSSDNLPFQWHKPFMFSVLSSFYSSSLIFFITPNAHSVLAM